MGKQIHYEVFLRRGASPGWVLFDAINLREQALRTAQDELAAGRCTGIKVVRETYDDVSGDFLSLTILEDGTRKVKVPKEAEDAPPSLPCLTPDDFYSAHARATLGKLFADTLARWKLTVTELIHRADMLEKLEATGTLFQHAVQKIAVAQAAGPNGQPVVTTIRALNDLADRAIKRVYREDRAGRIPSSDSAEAFCAHADRQAGEGAFAIGLAFAAYLAPAKGWTEKLERVLAVLAAPPQTTEAARIVLAMADDIVAEILGGSAALAELMGPMPDLGHALMAMSDLYLARTHGAAADSAIGRLSAFFGADQLLDARTALARRVLAELRAHKKLAPGVEQEMLHLRAITSRLVLGPPRLVPHEDIVAAITVRSRRLVQADVVGEYLQTAATAVEKAERLLALEENVVGAENKRRIWDTLKPIMTAQPFEAALLDPRLSPLDRLAQAAELQKRLMRSSLPDTAKAEGAALIDAITRRALDPARLATAAEAAGDAMLLTLLAALKKGAVPKGESETALRAAIARTISSGALPRALAADAVRRKAGDPAAHVRGELEAAGLIRAAKTGAAA